MLPCPPGEEGIRQRRCSHDAVWQAPTSTCYDVLLGVLAIPASGNCWMASGQPGLEFRDVSPAPSPSPSSLSGPLENPLTCRLAFPESLGLDPGAEISRIVLRYGVVPLGSSFSSEVSSTTPRCWTLF